MKHSYIHGENSLVPIDPSELPSGAHIKPITTDSYIVGHSETGHHHILEAEKGSSFQMILDGPDMYIVTSETSNLVHKKTHDIHETIVVDPGTYKVTHKSEYDPFQQVIRAVWD